MGLQRSKMPPTQKKCISGLPQNFFLLLTMNQELQIPLRKMTKQHATTLRFEAYLMGKLTNVIWGDD
jgi:hypothetical protein